MEDHLIGRKALYDLVWSEPISKLAELYGYSDVGFSKVCQRAGIPLPPRGHWARISAGQTPRRTPLPPTKPGQRDVRLVPLTEEEKATWIAKRAQYAAGRKSVSPDKVAAEANQLHPLAKAARNRLKQAASSDYKGLRSAPKEILDIAVTNGSIDRATQIASVIVRELLDAGTIIRIDCEKGCTVLELRDTEISLKISEQVARTPHEPTVAEKRALERYRTSRWASEYPHIPQYDFIPTGLLTITASGWPQRNWRDTKRTPLERRIGEVLVGIISLAEEVRDREAESARRRAAYMQREERYKAEIERRAAEKLAYESLLSDAKNWAAAHQVREYLRAIEAAAQESGQQTEALVNWLEWANRMADRLDPAILVSDVILDAPEPQKPNYNYW